MSLAEIAYVLAEGLLVTLAEAADEANLPVSTDRPALDPGIVRGLVMESHDRLDARPLPLARRNTKALLKRRRREKVPENAETRGGGHALVPASGWHHTIRLVEYSASSASITTSHTHFSSSTSSWTLASLAPTNTQISSLPLPAARPGRDAIRKPPTLWSA